MSKTELKWLPELLELAECFLLEAAIFVAVLLVACFLAGVLEHGHGPAHPRGTHRLLHFPRFPHRAAHA